MCWLPPMWWRKVWMSVSVIWSFAWMRCLMLRHSFRWRGEQDNRTASSSFYVQIRNMRMWRKIKKILGLSLIQWKNWLLVEKTVYGELYSLRKILLKWKLRMRTNILRFRQLEQGWACAIQSFYLKTFAKRPLNANNQIILEMNKLVKKFQKMY